MNGPAFISIRGSEPEGVRYSLEGTPLHGAGVTSFDVNTILPELIQRMDIYRTTVPIAYGNVSTGGVVDFQLRDARRREVFASAGYGSFGSWKASIAGSAPLPDGHLRIAASMRQTRGNFRFYNTNGTDFNLNDDNPNERRINNDATQGGLMLIRDQWVDDWRFRLISITDLWSGGISGIDVAQSASARGRRLNQNLIFSARRRFDSAHETTLQITGSLQIRRADFLDKDGEVGVGKQERTDRQALAFLSTTTETKLPHQLTLSTAFDLQLEHDTPKDLIVPHYVHASSRVYPSVGAELRWDHPQEFVSIAAGARASLYHQRTDADDVPVAPEASTTDYAFTPQLGIVVQPLDDGEHRVQLASYVSRAHRQPGFEELFGDSGGTIGNSELRPEKQTSLEILGSYRWTRGTWRFDARAQAWFQWRDDAIEYFALATGARKPMNIDGAKVRGQELSLVAHHETTTLSAHFGHMHSENLSVDPQVRGMQLPWRSPWSASLDARVRPLATLSTHRLEWISTLRYDAAFFADARNRREYPARVELDMGLEFDSGWRNVPSIRVEAFNLLNRRSTTLPGRDGGRDVDIIRPISDYFGQPRPGRSFYVTLTWQLERE